MNKVINIYSAPVSRAVHSLLYTNVSTFMQRALFTCMFYYVKNTPIHLLFIRGLLYTFLNLINKSVKVKKVGSSRHRPHSFIY